MSTREISAPARATSDAQLRSIHAKWTSMLRRAEARERALNAALAHARAAESRLRRQLEDERRRHTIETGLLRERLRRLERCLLSYAAGAREAVGAPLQAIRQGAKALAEARAGSVAPANPRPETAARVSAPFDPAAIVASLLPLDQADDCVEASADTATALRRLRTVLGAPADVETPIVPETASPVTSGSTDSSPDERRADLPVEALASHSKHGHEQAASADTPWFPRAFRRLAEEDPQAAGRLLLQLLPAQALVWPEDIAYRIDVAETGVLAVRATGGRCDVLPLLETDTPSATEPALHTDLAGLARIALARRGLGRVGARIGGSRNRHVRALRALAAAPLELRDLRRAGALPDPALLLRLMALAIDPQWTAHDVFTIACRWQGRDGRGCYVHVAERAPVAVLASPPIGRVTATLTCAPDELLDLLLGEIGLEHSSLRLGGDHAALASLVRWLRQVDATATAQPASRQVELLTAV